MKHRYAFFQKLLLITLLILLITIQLTEVQAKTQKTPVFTEGQMKPIGLDIDSFIYSESTGYVMADIVLGEPRADAVYSKIQLYQFDSEVEAISVFENVLAEQRKAGDDVMGSGNYARLGLIEADAEYGILVQSQIKDLFYGCYYCYRKGSLVAKAYFGAPEGLGNQAENLFKVIPDTIRNLTVADGRLHGQLLDTFGQPMPYVQMIAWIEDSIFFSITDEQGEYSFNPDQVKTGDEGLLFAPMYCVIDMQTHFRIRYKGGGVVTYGKAFRIKSSEDLQLDFNLNDVMANPDKYSCFPNGDEVRHYSAVYQHMFESVKFYTNKIGLDMKTLKLPLEIVMPSIAADFTSYDFSNNAIHIIARDGLYDSVSRPMNREWHEFSHYVMFCLYHTVPTKGTIDLSHRGYANSTTCDSFLEGYAEFMSCVMAEYYKYPNPQNYPGTVGIEANYDAWDCNGTAEEYAFAGVLWDLFDSPNFDDDTVSMGLDEFWPIIMNPKNRTVNDFYLRLISAYPDISSAIDQIFINHGFFADTQSGDGIYNHREPFLDLNDNGKFDPGYKDDLTKLEEFFIDMGADEKGNLLFDSGEIVGAAANYLRLNPLRRNAVQMPGQYIKADGVGFDFQISYIFRDNPELNFETTATNIGGKLSVAVPPPAYQATLTINPIDASYDEKLVIDSAVYYQDLEVNIERDYFFEHDFGINGTPPTRDALEDIASVDAVMGSPYWESKGVDISETGQLEEAPLNIDFLKSFVNKKPESGINPMKVMGLVLLALSIPIAIVAFFYVKRRANSYRHR